MASLGGSPTPSDGLTSGGFYTATKAHSYTVYNPPSVTYPGQSKYPSAEAAATAQPFADIGRINVSPFQPMGTQPPPGNIPMPGAADMIKANYGDIPGADIVGGGLDFLSNIAGHLNGLSASPQANEWATKMLNTPDNQLTPEELQAKQSLSSIFFNPPDSPLMQGKQISEMYKAAQIADAHKRGTSAMLTAGIEPQDMLNPFTAFGLGTDLLKRYWLSGGVGATPAAKFIGGVPIIGALAQIGPGDQLQALKEGTPDTLGPERQAIKDQWTSGRLNDEEARDALAQSSFALSNPNPVKIHALGPVGDAASIAVNGALALAGETVTNPLSLLGGVGIAGGFAEESASITVSSILRSISGRATADEARTLGIDVAEHMGSAAGKATGDAAASAVSKQVEEIAARQVAGQAISRNLPREATALAKQTGRVAAEHISPSDTLSVLRSLGAQEGPLGDAIKEGIQSAGFRGTVATRLPQVVRMGEAVNKMTDPFSMFGYWKTGRVVPAAMSHLASMGFHDAIGWRVAQRLDDLYKEAGIDPEVADSSRYISAANHVVQVGDRANTARAVAMNSVFRDGGTPTEDALATAAKRGDIRRLVRNQVDRTLEFIVPATKGGKAAAEAEWRDRAARQLVDMGAERGVAGRVAAKMGEREMRALANDYYGFIINTVDKARRDAKPNEAWPQEAINRVAYMGPRQMTQQDATQIAKDVEAGNVEAVRAAVHRFQDLNLHISESLDDAQLMRAVKRTLGQINDALPVAIENTDTLPPELADFVKSHPGYNLRLRPEDDKLMVPIRNEDGVVTGMHTWLDNVTERTPKVEVTTAKAIQEGLFRGVSGGEIERNVERRFVANMAQSDGLAEGESMAILRAMREGAKIANIPVGPQGLTAESIYRAVDLAKLPSARRELAKRTVIDNMLDAYENEARLVGVLPKLTGWAKQEVRRVPGMGGNQLGWTSGALYQAQKFQQNPFFLGQERVEAPFFLALQGRYPMSLMVPDVAAEGLARVGLGGIKAAKHDINLWNNKTMLVMDRLTRMSANAEFDFFEQSELAKMGIYNAAAMTDDRTALGHLLGTYRKVGVGGFGLAQRKQRSVYLAARAEYGETFRRSIMANSPASWYAVRAYYPKSFSDGDVAVQWTLDLMSRSNPDAVYSVLSPNLFQPSHIGARAEISDQLLRHFVYGEADAPNHTWEGLVGDVKSGAVSIDQVRNELKLRGADPDYVERAVHQLTFGTPDEFYQAAIDHGVTPEAVSLWRAGNEQAAKDMGVSEREYLARNFTGRPIEVDQNGNYVGDTLFDDIVESMRVRGKDIPEADSAAVQAQKDHARGMITDVLPKPKLQSWAKARANRLADPTLGAPPMQGVAEAIPFARFGTDARGNATLPEGFMAEPGYVHRVVHQNRVNADWRAGEYVSSGKPATYIASNDQYVIQRARRDVTDWEPTTGGVNATENLTAKTAVPKGAIEVLHEDGQWRPVAPPPKMGPALWSSPIHTIGPITPEQYRRQFMAMMDPEVMGARHMRAATQKDFEEALAWYDHIRRAQFALTDPALSETERAQQAARHLVAFGVTQLNTTPADGFRYVFKAMGMLARGETLPDEEKAILQSSLGLNASQLQSLIFDESPKIEQAGIAQKLYDFIDSLAGSERRTNGILGPNGDWGPVAVDVWMKRDFGYLDPKMADWVYRLIEKPGTGGEGLVTGVSSKFTPGHGFDITMSDGSTEHIPMSHITESVPTDHQYDYGVEFANNVRDYFNSINFMDRHWNSSEVQALGWYRMQMLKSSEGDFGGVSNAMFEQSRWMGSNDLVPSVRAPMHEVHPWDQVVSPEHYRAIVGAGARHASDEAETLSGAHTLTKMDADSVVNGAYRPAQTVELLGDPSTARQYLAHYLYLSEQDSGVLMRDYTGSSRLPNYAKGVGLSVDIPVRDAEHAQALLQTLAADPKAPLQAIGPHTFVARAHDGSLHLRTLWVPGEGEKPTLVAFDRAVARSGLVEATAKEGVEPHDTLVDFIHLKNDWAAQPDGKSYMDEIVKGGGGPYGAMRTPEQRAATIAQAEQAYADAKVAGGKTAIAAAEREVKRARAAPTGRPESEVRQLVGESRVRVRGTVTAQFDKRASREVRNERERVLGEARDAAGDSLGTDPTVDDVLGLPGARGSNGERLFDRAPNGVVRAAITRSDSQYRRAQLHFSKQYTTDESFLHELFHDWADDFDDSANRTIAGQHAGLEGTPYGTWHPGTALTPAQHEWLVNQMMLWSKDPDTVHPTMQPLLKYMADKMASARTMRSRATSPATQAIKTADLEISRLTAHRATLKAPYAIARIDAQIAEHRATKATAQAAAKELRAQGGLSPDVKAVLDRMAAQAGKQTETKASTFNRDEQEMLGWAQSSMAAAQSRANNLVHMRGERSPLERSINHPFLGIYPASYMWGKVLPFLTEFLMFRPFGLRAPGLALTMGNDMYQSFNRQQQYDPKFREYLYRNEPYLRAMSMMAPGTPWDAPVGFPGWARVAMQTWLDNQVAREQGRKEKKVDLPTLIEQSAIKGLSPRLDPSSYGQLIPGITHLPELAGTMLTGQVQPGDLSGQPPQPQQ